MSPQRERSPNRTAGSPIPERVKESHVTFNEKAIKDQAQEALSRKAALRAPPVETGPKTKEPDHPEGAVNQTPKGGGFWKRRKQRLKQEAARKGKGKGKKGIQTSEAEPRRVEIK